MRKIYSIIISLLVATIAVSQTNPAVQGIPYSQDFSGLAHTSTTYPAGWQGWTISTSPGATFNTGAPTADKTLTASSTAAINTGNIHNYNGKIGLLNNTSLDLGIVLALNATGKSNVQVTYDIMTIRNPYNGTTDTRINEVTLQYRIGTTGAFTNLTGIEYQNNTTLQTGAVTTPQNSQNKSIALPASCNNQPVVQIRWASRQISGSGSRASFAVDNILVNEISSSPAIITLSPANLTTNVPLSFPATVTFNTNIIKGTGNITIKKLSDNSIIQTINVATAAVTVSNNQASFTISGLAYNTSYYVEMDSGTFTDGANSFSGITGSATWSFTTTVSAQTGVIGMNYSFNTCSGSFPDGFSQYSVIGPQIWACTTFGRDPSNPTLSLANGVQMNGFSTTNIPNEDWFISPAFDLTATNFPLLSFWSRTKFNGVPLGLKISTNYPGYGNPRDINWATWTDLNGKFPAQTSDIWTLSENINLSAFKTTGVYFGFVYYSSSDDGARWTLDDILITNSPTASPPSLTISTSDLQFGFAGSGGTVDKTFTVRGNDITGNITLTSTAGFTLADNPGGPFNSSLTLTQITSNNITRTVYARFSPTQNNINYTGTITIETPGTSNAIVTLHGTSIDPVNTLEVVNWNIEWFGSPTNGPTNDALQQANVQAILQNIGADIYGLLEVVDETRLANVVNNMPGYSYVICNYGSHTNINESGPTPLNQAQKEAFVYKTSMFSNITTAPVLSQGINSVADLTNPAYNYFASGRFPYMLTADVTLNGITQNIRFVLIHAKANTSPTITSYNRRKSGSDTLHQTLNALYPNDKIIFIGDYNDDLDSTITDGINPKITSYVAFTNDNVNFFSPTLPLSLAGKRSTVNYNDVIDHAEISIEMQCYYMSNSANILTDVANLVSNYGTTTSDHYPVFTRYSFDQAPGAAISYPIPTYCINGGTATVNRIGTPGGVYSSTTGLSINSSTGDVTLGTSTSGTYTVTYTIPAAGGCSQFITTTSITINSAPIVFCPANFSVSSAAPAFALTGGSPAGGTYSGTGVNAGNFDPAIAGPGTHTITYTYTNISTGCTSSCTFTITVTSSTLANDDAPGAISLIVDAGCSSSPFTNAGATQSGSEPFAACKGTAGYKTVWFKFLAPSSGNVRISNDYSGGTMGNDSRIALFSVDDVNIYATFTNLACDDDNGSVIAGKSILYATGLTPGNTYYIQVDGKVGSTATGTFCLAVDEMNVSMISASTSCASGMPLNSVNDNYPGWISLTDINGKLIGLINNPSGGATTSTYANALNINTGTVREYGNLFYLDRNYLISNAAVSNVNVQFFFLASELAALQTADPGVTLANLQVTRQTGNVCDNDFIAANGANSSIAQTGNGAGTGFKWIQLQTPGFSKFYLHTKKAFLPVKTFLQGDYNIGLSRHRDVTTGWVAILNANALSQPYNVPPFNYSGIESVTAGFFTSTNSTKDIVDWVLLEVRNATTPSTVITRRAAFIREDGRIVDLDGTSDISFRTIVDGNYHVVIRHRNHMAIRTSSVITLDGTMGFVAQLYNFSSAQTQAYQNTAITSNAAMKDLTGGVFGMWGGNGNRDGQIRASGPLGSNDYGFLITTTLGGNVTTILSNVYNSADTNMDGQVRASGPLGSNDYGFLITTTLSGDVTKIFLQHQ